MFQDTATQLVFAPCAELNRIRAETLMTEIAYVFLPSLNRIALFFQRLNPLPLFLIIIIFSPFGCNLSLNRLWNQSNGIVAAAVSKPKITSMQFKVTTNIV